MHPSKHHSGQSPNLASKWNTPGSPCLCCSSGCPEVHRIQTGFNSRETWHFEQRAVSLWADFASKHTGAQSTYVGTSASTVQIYKTQGWVEARAMTPITCVQIWVQLHVQGGVSVCCCTVGTVVSEGSPADLHYSDSSYRLNNWQYYNHKDSYELVNLFYNAVLCPVAYLQVSA